MMIFRQLFDEDTSTYTYLIADDQSNEAVFIDPVNRHTDTYIKVLQDAGLTLKYSLETHVHADHITASGLLRQRLGAETGVSQGCGASYADRQLQDGDVLSFGNEEITVITTPGHTPGSVSFRWRDRLFTGDALLINGCGRTDFQGGDAGTLYDSITQRLFTLPDETLVCPGHDYNGRWVSNIAQERVLNPRLAGKSRDEFIEIMDSLDLPEPRLIDEAVPANRLCGLSEEEARQDTAQQQPNGQAKEYTVAQDLVNEAKQQINEITVEGAARQIQKGGVTVIDVREPDEYTVGHLAGAINIPRGVLEFQIDKRINSADKASPVLLYCGSGARSALAALALKRLGYTNVLSMAEGYRGWQGRTPPNEQTKDADAAKCG